MFNKNKFKAQLALKGLTMKELASKLGLNESTMYRKFNADGAFDREEINEMIEILGIEDPMGIFFAREIA